MAYNITYKLNGCTTIKYNTNNVECALKGVIRYLNKGIQIDNLTIKKN